MVRGAAKRERQLQVLQRRQEPVEQGAIFQGELARQPAVASVVKIEPRLNASQGWGASAEGGMGFAQLVPLGPILRVIDNEILAASER